MPVANSLLLPDQFLPLIPHETRSVFLQQSREKFSAALVGGEVGDTDAQAVVGVDDAVVVVQGEEADVGEVVRVEAVLDEGQLGVGFREEEVHVLMKGKSVFKQRRLAVNFTFFLKREYV